MPDEKKSAPAKKERSREALYEETEKGTIRVDDEVIASIAAFAALAVEGVADMVGGMTDGLSEMFGKRSASKGVKLETTPDGLTVELNLLVHYGTPIPDLAHHVQRDVSERILEMTGLKVNTVNVVVQGMQFPNDGPKEDPHEQ